MIKKKPKFPKFNEKSELIITEYKGTKEFMDLFGNLRKRILKDVFVSNEGYSLGSLMKPNKKVMSIKWEFY